MVWTPRLRERAQSRGEEIANSVSHGIGLFAAVIGAWALVWTAAGSGDVKRAVACTVYATTLVLMYAASTVYHGLPRGRGKYVCRIVDHGAIFLLIAGSYTPILLGSVQGRLGSSLLVMVWIVALAGIVMTAISRVRYPTLSTAAYLALGWLLLVAARPLWETMDHRGLLWIAAGGLAYTAGVGFFAADRLKYGHLVWHLFVIAGSACHYVVVARYAF